MGNERIKVVLVIVHRFTDTKFLKLLVQQFYFLPNTLFHYFYLIGFILFKDNANRKQKASLLAFMLRCSLSYVKVTYLLLPNTLFHYFYLIGFILFKDNANRKQKASLLAFMLRCSLSYVKVTYLLRSTKRNNDLLLYFLHVWRKCGKNSSKRKS